MVSTRGTFCFLLDIVLFLLDNSMPGEEDERPMRGRGLLSPLMFFSEQQRAQR
jgi:hypothetical protein